MRSTPRLSGAAAGFLLAALPSLLLAQSPGGSPSSSAPAPPASGSVGSSAPASSGVSSSSGSSGGSYSSGGSSGYSGGSSYSGRPGSGSPGGGYSPSRGSYGGNHFDGPRGYAPGSPGRVTESQPPARVELPGPRVGPPGMRSPAEPVTPGYTPSNPLPPRVGTPGGTSTPDFGAPGRVGYERPGRVQLPGRVEVPGVIGLPERPGQRDFAPGDDPNSITRPGDDDTRLLPPPTEPGVGKPVVGKPVPEKPLPPSQPSYQPPTNTGPDNRGLLSCYYGGYGYGYNQWCNGYYSRWNNWPFWGSSRSCYYWMMMQDEMDIYFSRMRGETWSGCYGYDDYYGDAYGYYGYGRGFYNVGWMNLMPCAVVTAETYGGRKYSIVTMLPEFGAYGPRGLRLEIMSRLHEDGEVTLQGRGSQELHLFDGFVKRVNARWCYGGEW